MGSKAERWVGDNFERGLVAPVGSCSFLPMRGQILGFDLADVLGFV